MNCERRSASEARATRRWIYERFGEDERPLQPAGKIAVEPDRQQLISTMEEAAQNPSKRPFAEALAARARWDME